MYVIRNDSGPEINPSELKQFFVSHLNRIYCAKSQLEDKLPVIAGHANAHELRLAVAQTIDMVTIQIGRLEEIYARLGSCYTPESCLGLLGFLDEAFQSIGPPFERPSLRDMSILFYMQNIESIEMVSFEVMMRLSEKLDQSNVTELLHECYLDARNDKSRFSSLAGKYI